MKRGTLGNSEELVGTQEVVVGGWGGGFLTDGRNTDERKRINPCFFYP
jgi:hypothetical protein